jgi:hypothetical protein
MPGPYYTIWFSSILCGWKTRKGEERRGNGVKNPKGATTFPCIPPSYLPTLNGREPTIFINTINLIGFGQGGICVSLIIREPLNKQTGKKMLLFGTQGLKGGGACVIIAGR